MRSLFIIFFLFLGLNMFFSCKYDEDYTSENRLAFSSDTVFFDTIFTTLGSTYQRPTVHNPHNKTMLISSIRVGKGEASPFRINIDGDTNYHFQNIEIPAKDFIHVFIRVTIDPTDKNVPFLVEDSIEFNVNGTRQYMKLVAFGQNAYYHLPTQELALPDGSSAQGFYAGCAEAWNNDKPHIIYGTCLIEDSTWNVSEGTKIHLASNAQIVAGRNAYIKINGSLENPVVFTGIRKDRHYSQSAGQWNRIWLSSQSNSHTIKHAIIENGNTGIMLDTNGVGNMSIDISNTIIRNMAHSGIEAQNAEITGTNLVVAYCKGALLSIKKQGDYKFTHCTFANYWGSNYWDNADFRRTPCVTIDTLKHNNSLSVSFLNCVIYGNSYNEISIPSGGGGISPLLVKNCFIKASSTEDDIFMDCIFNENPYFVDTKINDLKPTANSPFIGKGSSETGVSTLVDIEGNSWRNPPTIGAYEYVE